MRVIRLLWISLLAVLLFAGGAFWVLLESEVAAGAVLEFLSEVTGGSIHARAAEGPLKGPLLLEGFVYEDHSVRLEIERVRLDWNALALLRRQLRVRELEAGPVRLTLKPHPPSGKPAATSLPLALVVKSAQIESFTLFDRPGAKPVIFADINGAVDWYGDTIQLARLQTRFEPVGRIEAKGALQLRPAAIALRGIEIHGLGTLRADGVIHYDNRVEAQLSWEQLRWPQEGDPLLLSAHGEAELDGTWSDFAFELNGPLELTLTGGLQGLVGAHGRGSVRGLDVAELNLETLGGRVQAQGSVTWLPQVTLAGSGQFEGLLTESLAPQWPGLINGRFDGAMTQLKPLSGQLQLQLEDSELRAYALDLHADAEANAGAFRLNALELTSGGSRLTARGDVYPALDATAELSSRNLAELLPDFSGSAQLALRLRGTREQPHLVTDATLRAVQFKGVSAEQIDLKVDLAAGRQSLFDLELKKIRAGIQVERATLKGSGTPANNRFDLHIRSALGDFALGLNGVLDLRALQWSGEILHGRGQPLRLSPWVLEEGGTFLSLGLQGFQLSPACWRSDNGRACTQTHLSQHEQRIAFRLEEQAFAYVEPLLPPGWTLQGTISGTGLFVQEQRGMRASADLKTSAGRLTIGGHEVLSFAPSRWLAEETTKGFISTLELPLQDGGIFWNALLSPAEEWERRRWSGEVRADLTSLQALRLFSPELESVNGELHGRFDISGNAGAPRLQGSMKLSDGRLRLATPGIELNPLSAEITSEARSGALLFTASASSGGGTLAVNGSADGRKLSELGNSLKMDLSGDNFQLAATSQARIWVSPKLEFTLDRRRADLRGEVLVPRADITPTTFDQGIGPSNDQIIIGDDGAADDGGLVQIYSNVRVVLGEAVKFDGFGLKTQLTGALNASDQPGQPTRGRGEVQLVGGKYKAYGQDLSITTGRLLFNGGPITAPAVDIRAERKPTDEVTVGLNVRGLLTAPEFNLFSTPSMPQEQQLAWLVLGRSLAEVGQSGSNTAQDRDAISGAALSLGLSGSNFLAQKVRGNLGLDEISIGSGPGQSGNQAQLTFGKYLSPKLYVSYGIGLFQPGQAFRLLYDIGGGFKLRTESGVESGGDIIYTVEK